MAVDYPVGLPVNVERGSFNVSPVVPVIRHNVAVGKPMVRNRYTGDLFNVNWRILMTDTECATLLDWYNNELDKNLKFNFPEPILGTIKEYSFIQPPKFSHIGNNNFMVDFNLRRLESFTLVQESSEWTAGDILEWTTGDNLTW